MARRRRNKRYRRSRLTVPLRILSFLLICGAIAAALILFFKVQTVVVDGNERYTDQEVLDVAQIQIGENMFLLNKYAISGQITSELPYIQSVQIRRGLPDTIYIRVEECTPVAAVVQGDEAWLVSRKGKLLEKTAVSQAAAYPQIVGCELLLPTVSSSMSLPQDGNITLERLMELLGCLENRGMLDKTERIDCSDPDMLVLRYAGRFDVQMLYNADFDKKLNALEQIIAQLQENETGTVILTMPDKSSFKPAR